jgi:small subunit ribosomal protein S4
MVREIGSKQRRVRRLGALPGLTVKISNRHSTPGEKNSDKQKSKKRRKTQFGIRLEEKQKIRFNYGISDTQLINYVKEAKKTKDPTGARLLRFLEMRLDTIIFKAGLAPTIASARQLVNHEHILVNGHCVSIPSYRCKKLDMITIRPTKTSKRLVRANIEEIKAYGTNAQQEKRSYERAKHIACSEKDLSIKVLEFPHRKSIELTLNELFVIEYYSRKI